MLEYCKTILTRVSFDVRLFEKELRKAIRTLVEDEVRELRAWCYKTFIGELEMVLDRCFSAA